MNRHHAFVIEAEAEEGIAVAQAWAEKELGMKMSNTECWTNPDMIVLRYGLFSVEDARNVCDTAAGAPFAGEYKVLIIAASRAYHEAQNALLKLFEEPPEGTFLFFILPSLGGLLPTLRSRVQILDFVSPQSYGGLTKSPHFGIVEEFIKASKDKRSAIIKKLTSGKDEEEKRELRDEAIAIVNGIEAVAYAKFKKSPSTELGALLSDIATLRSNLYDRSAPVRMILEHLSLVIPKDLL
ncbi:hypothetical protein A2609_03325 [Candidatus Kaiserbacteria bacterium RIFOXYD1_FULL_47_14]|uniref:DNA polymerase III subunit delta n=1 Tax=Candidatus Kaiserbacteria bacterium RIFOXYD1_FULL_47_14 TaxID=1798533 RepID=A0A1F6G3U3_9BACT|nr:MAG: hypothetical protein A2609_03325 [Candidatus Kaiserbacteria bacterium RIFOXYD1_FULL_47_14]